MSTVYLSAVQEDTTSVAKKNIALPKPPNVTIKHPPVFTATIFADGLGSARHLYK